MLFLVPFIINGFFELGIVQGGFVPHFNCDTNMNILEN